MPDLLIDAGRSLWGWSGIGSFVKCPRMWALNELSEGRNIMPRGPIPGSAGDVPPSVHLPTPTPQTQAQMDSAERRDEARTWGSMGHCGLAHFYTLSALSQDMTVDGSVRVGTNDGIIKVGKDSSGRLYSPAEAATQWCTRNDKGFGSLAEVVKMLTVYQQRNRRLQEQVLAVEWPVLAVVGVHPIRGIGLWVLDQDTFREPGVGDPLLSVIDQAEIVPWRLDVPGHPRHGLPLYLSRRIDLVSYDGRYWIDDHKCLAHVEPKLARTAYAVDRGNAALRMMGAQIWGQYFGGVRINFVSKRPKKGTSSFYFTRKEVAVSRAQEWSMAGRLYDAYHERARYQVQTSRGEREVMPTTPGSYCWPDAGHDVGACKHRYGNCDYLEADGDSAVRRCVG